MDITKVVIPAAGIGTRFLPYTKAVPKEMLPLLNQPALHYIIEEAFNSSIQQFMCITSRGKTLIEDYFDHTPELKQFLKEENKESLITNIEKIMRIAEFTYIRQAEHLGLGHAIWLARHCIQKEYFGVMLPDDIVVGKQPALEQLIRTARQEKASVIAVQEVPTECIPLYGIINVKRQITQNLFQISNIVEKPDKKNAPSNLAVIGRYVLSHKIFVSLEEMTTYSIGEELQLTDAINNMLQNNEKVFAHKVSGTRYDIGSPIGWVKAIIGLALQHPQYSRQIKKFLVDRETADSFLYNQSKNIE